MEEQKLVISADNGPEVETNKFKDSVESKSQQLDQLKNELEQKDLENKELKKDLEKLTNSPKKNFWQRLFK
ncbi:hypothetical protein [Vagococcus sp.]|uniref:hypothetical protein n=1 Tax=Vagococcus sp. TaxID=1933889 RepID=UPI002FC89AA7